MKEDIQNNEIELKILKKRYRLTGFSFFVLMVVVNSLQFALSAILVSVNPDLVTKDWYIYLVSFAPLYLIGLPLIYLLMRNKGSKSISGDREQKKLSFGKMLVAFCIAYSIMYFANLFGTLVNTVITFLTGAPAVNPLEQLGMDGPNLLLVLFAVIGAPIIEEFMFRKLLIDKIREYGEGTAIVISGLFFGLFHGNLSQFFYAFVLGMFFAFIYIRTNRLRYTIILHMCINFVGTVIGTTVLKYAKLDEVLKFAQSATPDYTEITRMMQENIGGLALFGGYFCFVMLLTILGLIFLIVFRKKFTIDHSYDVVPKGKKASIAWFNIGMILYYIASAVIIIMGIVINAFQV